MAKHGVTGEHVRAKLARVELLHGDKMRDLQTTIGSKEEELVVVSRLGQTAPHFQEPGGTHTHTHTHTRTHIHTHTHTHRHTHTHAHTQYSLL